MESNLLNNGCTLTGVHATAEEMVVVAAETSVVLVAATICPCR